MRAHVQICPSISAERKAEAIKFQTEKSERVITAEGEEELEGSVTKRKRGRPRKEEYINGSVTPARPAVQAKKETAPPPKSPITCHVLDSTSGRPGAEMKVQLDKLTAGGFEKLADGMTDGDGRCSNLLPPLPRCEAGIYKMTFQTTEYFSKRGINSFYPFVEITFELKNPSEHYHIPLLLAPYSYSTYRGS